MIPRRRPASFSVRRQPSTPSAGIELGPLGDDVEVGDELLVDLAVEVLEAEVDEEVAGGVVDAVLPVRLPCLGEAPPGALEGDVELVLGDGHAGGPEPSRPRLAPEGDHGAVLVHEGVPVVEADGLELQRRDAASQPFTISAKWAGL